MKIVNLPFYLKVRSYKVLFKHLSINETLHTTQKIKLHSCTKL